MFPIRFPSFDEETGEPVVPARDWAFTLLILYSAVVTIALGVCWLS
jgi:hypothetical protein